MNPESLDKKKGTASVAEAHSGLMNTLTGPLEESATLLSGLGDFSWISNILPF